MPSVKECYRPVLEAIQNGASSIRDMVPAITAQFDLTPEEQEELIPSGTRTRIHDRVDWAHYQLFRAGLTQRISRGRYELTESGSRLLTERNGSICDDDLRCIPQYASWKAQSGAHKVEQADAIADMGPDDADASVLPPSEMIETAAKALDAELSEELLQALLAATPARFERIIVDLLVAMGYGRGLRESGIAIGRSGDGGIDGIVNEDALGLDAVYIQAKRYAPENKVGRPAVQAFIGAMTGESATKGVFVTTSGFSSEARDYVGRVQQRVVLIDGRELARLLIAHEVGVRARRTYVVRSVDEDFFVES
jgi:restriction system protein